MMGHLERIERTVRKFCQDLPLHLQSLVEMVEEQRTEAHGHHQTARELAAEVHRLAGASHSLGFKQVGRSFDLLYADIETVIENDACALPAAFPRFQEKLQALLGMSQALKVRKSRLLERMKAMIELQFETEDAANLNAPDAGRSLMSKQRILFVDDDPYVLDVMGDTLRSMGVGDIWFAHSGTEALSLMRLHQPTMIITDWKMPGLDGLELLKSIRSGASAVSHDIPVLFFSAKKLNDDVMNANRHGVTMFLPKPIMPEKLKEAVLSITEKGYRSRVKLKAAS